MNFNLTNIIAIGGGAWAGKNFLDLGLVEKFEQVTEERFAFFSFALGFLALISPSYFKKKISGKVPGAVLYGLGGYLIGAGYGVYMG